MAAWRDYLIDLFPDKEEWWRDSETIYTAHCYLRGYLSDLRKPSDEPIVERIFEYAGWCLYHEDHDYSNSIGVSFYEHLADDDWLRRLVVRYVTPRVWRNVDGLMEFMAKDEKEFRKLAGKMRKKSRRA